MIAEICHIFLDGFGMQVEMAPSIMAPIFKGNSDIRNCSCNTTVKLLEREMKVVERALEKGSVE